MRMAGKMLLVGAGIVAMAGVAAAAERRVHVMAIAMPDGSIERIRYIGDQPPRVMLAPVAVDPLFGPDFAGFDRLFQTMERQHAAIMRQVAARSAAGAAGPTAPRAGGSVNYTYVSSVSGGANGCAQSYRITSYGADRAPQVEQERRGNCANVPTLAPVGFPTMSDPAPTPKPAAAPTSKPAPATTDHYTI